MTIAFFSPSAIITPDIVLTQLSQELDPSFGLDDISHTANGAVFPGFTGSSISEAALDFSTPQIATFLEQVDSLGYAGIGFAVDDIVDIEWQKLENLKTRLTSASTSHGRMRSTLSYFYWKSISADGRGDAQLSARFKPISDGTNPPWVYANAAQIGTPVVSELFGLGPVTLNAGSALTVCCEGWSWENNVSEFSRTCSGAQYETFSCIKNVSPVVTLRGVENIDQVLSLLPGGKSISAMSCYLRKRTQGGGFVAPATAQHIQLSATVGSAKPVGVRSIQVSVHGFSINTGAALP